MPLGLGLGLDKIKRIMSTGILPGKLFLYNAGDDIASLGATFSRSSSATFTDYDGIIRTAASGTLRDGHYIGGERYTILEGQRTNLLAYSIPDPANWGVNGTASINSNIALAPDGTFTSPEVSASSACEVYHGFGATGIGYVGSAFVKGPSGYKLYISADGQDGTGSVLVTLSGEWQRVSVQSSSTFGFLIIGTLGHGSNSNLPTISFQVWGAQVEEGSFPSTYIPTQGSTVTRAADLLYFPIGFNPQQISVFCKFVELGTAYAGGNARLWEIDSTPPDSGEATIYSAGSGVYSFYSNGPGNNPTTTLNINDSVEMLGCLSSSSLNQSWSINNGAVSSSAANTTLIEAWVSPKVSLNSRSDGSSIGFNCFQTLAIVKGTQTIPWFRAALNPGILFEYLSGYDITAMGATYSRASSATYIDKLGNVNYATSGELRDNHYIRGRRKTLLEGQRTNLCLDSQGVFSGSNWSASATGVATDNVAIAPDGTLTASSLSLNSSGQVLAQDDIVFSGTGTASIWVNGTVGQQAYFYLDAGVGTSLYLVTFTGIWQRISFQGTDGYFYFGNQGRNGASNLPAVTFNIWGAQVEQGSFASTYIPTNGSTVTRAADSLSFPIGFNTQNLSVYAKYSDLGIFQTGSYATYWQLGGLGGTDVLASCAGLTIFDNTNGSGPANLIQSETFGDGFETVVQSLSNGGLGFQVSQNSGTPQVAANITTPQSLVGTWYENTLSIVGPNGSGAVGFAAFDALIIAQKTWTIQQFRDYLSPGQLFRYSAGDPCLNTIRVSGAGTAAANGDYILIATGTWHCLATGWEIDYAGGNVWNIALPGTNNYYTALGPESAIPSTLTWSLSGSGAGLNPVPTVTYLPFLQGTFTRASTATYLDGNGIVQYAAANQLRDAHYVFGERTCLLEGQSTNLITYGSDLTQWGQALSTTTNISAIAPDGSGTVSQIALADNANVYLQFSDVIDTYTFSAWVKGTAGEQVGLLISTGSGGPFSVITFTGEWQFVYMTGTTLLANSYAAFCNDGRVGTLPAVTFQAWGAQVEALPFPSSYIPTSGSAVTRAADNFTFPAGFNPQVLSPYVRFFDLGTGQSDAFVFFVGGTSDPDLTIYNIGGYSLYYGGGAQSSGVPLSSINDLVELSGTVNKQWESQLTESLNGGSLVTDTTGNTSNPYSVWSPATITINDIYGGGSTGFIALRDLIISKGSQNMGFFRALIS